MGVRYVFAGDPMCSWCYGFSHELGEALRDRPDVRLEVMVAGLWAGSRDVLDDVAKRFRLQHWGRVQQETDLSFNREALLAHTGLVYDTEPISRAFVAARQVAPEVAPLALFHALQRLFYVDGLDTTDEWVLHQALVRILGEHGCTLKLPAIKAAMQSPEIVARTQAEFATVRDWGLRSFPQLLQVRDGKARVLQNGFAKAAVLRGLFDRHPPNP